MTACGGSAYDFPMIPAGPLHRIVVFPCAQVITTSGSSAVTWESPSVGRLGSARLGLSVARGDGEQGLG
ncbi:predicted protein [Streptomyces sp. C]|nr:predicted protein [Streptomyces sp. C]